MTGMWFMIKFLFFMFMCFGGIIVGAMGFIPHTVAIIFSVGMFACAGLTISQLFCEDL
jgi:hypothetical protein